MTTKGVVLRDIRKNCLDCCNESYSEVSNCLLIAACIRSGWGPTQRQNEGTDSSKLPLQRGMRNIFHSRTRFPSLKSENSRMLRSYDMVKNETPDEPPEIRLIKFDMMVDNNVGKCFHIQCKNWMEYAYCVYEDDESDAPPPCETCEFYRGDSGETPFETPACEGWHAEPFLRDWMELFGLLGEYPKVSRCSCYTAADYKNVQRGVWDCLFLDAEVGCGYAADEGSGAGTISVPRGKVIVYEEERDYFHCPEAVKRGQSPPLSGGACSVRSKGNRLTRRHTKICRS